MRRIVGRSWAGFVLVALVAALAPAAPAATRPLSDARIDQALVRAVSQGPTLAILGWDTTAATRSDIKRHFASRGLEARVFERVPVAYACARTPRDLEILAAAPGAMTVVPNEPLTPATAIDIGSASSSSAPPTTPDTELTGEGMTLAVLDTGIDASHPDVAFGSRVETNVRVVFSNWDLVGPYDDPCWMDRYSDEWFGQMENTDLTSGHGTFITSVAAGDGTASEGVHRGMAPGADIAGIAVTDTVTTRVDVEPGCAGRGHQSYAEDYRCTRQLSTLGAVAGFNFVLQRLLVAEHPTKVILAGWVLDGLYDPWHPISLSIDVLGFFGISFVVPVGNGGTDVSDCSTASACTINPIGLGKSSIAVAASDTSGVLAEFSSRGDPEPRTYHDETVEYRPFITAPGTDTTGARATIATAPLIQVPGTTTTSGASGSGSPSTDTEYVVMSGTSVAAAHLAGAILLIQQAALEVRGCYLTGPQLKWVLETTADEMPGHERWEVGAGLFDLTGSLALARDIEELKTIPSNEPYMCP